MKIGTTIRELRRNKNMAQVELAKRTGLSQTSISLIESNEVRPHQSTIKKICKVLQCSEPVLYLLSITEQDVPKQKRVKFNKEWLNIKIQIQQLL